MVIIFEKKLHFYIKKQEEYDASLMIVLKSGLNIFIWKGHYTVPFPPTSFC